MPPVAHILLSSSSGWSENYVCGLGYVLWMKCKLDFGGYGGNGRDWVKGFVWVFGGILVDAVWTATADVLCGAVLNRVYGLQFEVRDVEPSLQQRPERRASTLYGMQCCFVVVCVRLSGVRDEMLLWKVGCFL